MPRIEPFVEMPWNTVRGQIVALMDERGIKAHTLSKYAVVSKASIHRYINGLGSVQLTLIERIAEALDADIIIRPRKEKK